MYVLTKTFSKYILTNTNAIITQYTQCKLKISHHYKKISLEKEISIISHRWHFTFSLDIIILTTATAAGATDVRNTKLDFNFEHFHRS